MKKIQLLFIIIFFTISVNATNYYVSTTGNDNNNGLSSETAWRTIAKACASVQENEGHIINLGAGTFLEKSTISIPSGVTIKGAGKGSTTIQGANTIFRCDNKSHITVSDFKIDGRNRTSNNGFYFKLCDNIEIKNFTMTGLSCTIEFRSGHDCKVHDFDGTNVSYCTANAISISSWHTDLCENFEIYNGICTNDDNAHGKIIGGGVDQTMPGYDGRPWDMPAPLINNIKIHDISFHTSRVGCYQEGQPQLGLEFWNCKMTNFEVYNMKCNMAFSFATQGANEHTGPLEKTIHVHHCRWEDCGDYGIEDYAVNMEIDHNYFDGCSYPIANFGNDQSFPVKNIKIHHNVFYNTINNACLNYGENIDGLEFYNNTIHLNYSGGCFNAPGSKNIEVYNNIFYSSVSGCKASGLPNANYHDNLFYKFEPVGTNATVADPLFTGSGKKPKQFFNLTESSPQKTYGAYPFGEKAWYAGPGFDTIPAYIPVPGKIEAENFENMEGVQTDVCTDTDGGLFVGWIHTNDWMEYNVNADAEGLYKLSLRVADFNSPGSVKIKSDTAMLAEIAIPATGGWSVYNTIVGEIKLKQGKQPLRLEATAGGWRINWLEVAHANTASILKHNSANGVEVYPNPTNGLVNVKLAEFKNASISVYDMQGRLLIFRNVTQNNEQIDLSAFNGILLLKINSNNTLFLNKIIVNLI